MKVGKPRLALMLVMLMAVLAVPLVALADPTNDASVSDYAIVWVSQTGPNELTVRVQANFCEFCNPNDANAPGCTPFTHGYPGYPPPYPDTTYWCGGAEAGRYAAVQVRDKATNTVLGVAKMILNTGNWPLAGIYQRNIVITGLALPTSPGDKVVVEADLYCSWCGHYYPCPVELEIIPPVGALEFPFESLEVLLPALAFLGLRLRARGRKTE